MAKYGYSPPKWIVIHKIVIHKSNIYCIELELKQKIKQINEPCCVGKGTYKYVPPIILNFNHPVKEIYLMI